MFVHRACMWRNPLKELFYLLESKWVAVDTFSLIWRLELRYVDYIQGVFRMQSYWEDLSAVNFYQDQFI